MSETGIAIVAGLVVANLAALLVAVAVMVRSSARPDPAPPPAASPPADRRTEERLLDRLDELERMVRRLAIDPPPGPSVAPPPAPVAPPPAPPPGPSADLVAELSGLRATLSATGDRLGGVVTRIERLERAVAALQVEPPRRAVGSEPERDAIDLRHPPAPIRPLVPPRAGMSQDLALARVPEIAQATAGSANGRFDDLTRLPGVGPELANRLRGLGFGSYAQLSRLNDDQLEVVAAALGVDVETLVRPTDIRLDAGDLRRADELGRTE